MKENKVVVNVEVKDIDANIKKAEHLVELLKEAKTLADELASVEFDFNV